MPSPLVEKTFQSRRSHRKSRAGCAACKQRRIKCDELRPSCSSCVRRSAECCYPQAGEERETVPACVVAGADQHEDPRPGPGVDSSPASYGSSLEQATFPFNTTTVSWNPEPPRAQFQPTDGEGSYTALRSVLDLQLLQHFTLDISRELAEESKDITLWQRLVPLIAFEFAFVMHALLAVSALSFARRKSSMKGQYLARAEMHHARSLPPFIHELSSPGEANIDALYVASVLLSFHHFAKGPPPGEYLIFSDRSPPDWLWLLGGVRALLDRRGRKPLQDLDSVHSEHKGFPAELLLQDFRVPLLNHKMALEQLRKLVDGFPEGFGAAVDNLDICFTQGFIDDGCPTGVRPRNHLIMAWLYLLDSSFLQEAQAKRPEALVIIAHFAALLHQLNHCWLMHDWGLHLMDGVYTHLPEAYKAWLQWPADVLSWKPPF